MEYTVRNYTDNDFLTVSKLETLNPGSGYLPAVFIRQMAELVPETFFVAEHAGEAIGYSIGAQAAVDPSRAWVLRMRVADGFQGQGVGKALLATVLDALGTSDIERVLLTVSPKNTVAVSLYTKFGFTVESFHEAYFGPGEDRYIMAKRLW